MKIIIGSDHLALEMKDKIKQFLETQNLVEIEEVFDAGVHSSDPVDYPDIAQNVAERIASGDFDRGILICGTGIGMAIAANKVPGVRAAQVYDPYSAERARKSNNAQIMTFGALTMGPATAEYLVGIWLQSEFAHGRSERKVEKINLIDEKYKKN